MMLLNDIKKISFNFVIGITLKKEDEILDFLEDLKQNSPKETLFVLFFDKSRDIETFNKSVEYAKKSKNIYILYDNETKDLADAYFRLYKFCSELKVKWIVSMNAGWRHDPKDLNKFLNFSSNKNIDCVWGYREKNTNKANTYRKLISYFGNILSNFLLNIKIKDLTSGFYMIRKEILNIEIKKIKKFVSKYHFLDTELKFYLKNYNYEQVKINYKSPNARIPLKIIMDSIKVLIFLSFKNRK